MIMLHGWTWIFQIMISFCDFENISKAKCVEPLVLSWKFPQVYLDYLQVCGRYKATERWKATAVMTVVLWFETSLCNLDSTKWQKTKDEDLKLQQLFRAILPLDQSCLHFYYGLRHFCLTLSIWQMAYNHHQYYCHNHHHNNCPHNHHNMICIQWGQFIYPRCEGLATVVSKFP